MSESIEKLKAAFAGESQANRRYLAFARKADEEGLTQMAKLFRAAAEAETVYALARAGEFNNYGFLGH
jgi:rubrerythrin